MFLLDLDGGGAERAIVTLAGELARMGSVVDLVIGDANSDYRGEVPGNVRLRDFGTRSPWKVLPLLVRYLRAHNPGSLMSALDVANIVAAIATGIARYKGRLVISQRAVIGASLDDLQPVRRAVTFFLQRLLFRRADALISNSQAAADELQSVLHVPAERVFTIRNALDIDRIRKLAAEPITVPFIRGGRVPLIVSVGSLTKRKDMATLIRAFCKARKIRPLQLAIVGKGPESDSLQKLVQSLGCENDVYFAGFDANPHKWVAAADVFVSSSMAEGFPNVIAEALALGRPIVATACPGDTADLLGNGTWGRLVPVGDADRMAVAIIETLDDLTPPQGQQRAAQFMPRVIAASYLNVLLPDRALP